MNGINPKPDNINSLCPSSLEADIAVASAPAAGVGLLEREKEQR
jgi:hypothetical protein